MRLKHLFLLFAVTASVRATTVEPPTFPDLVGDADSIYQGRVKSVESRRVERAEGSIIKTYVTLVVDQALKGSEQSEVILEFLGGTVGDETLSVSGMPKFVVGGEEILFVQKNGRQFCPLVAMMHGRYRVERDATGRRYVARENRAPLLDEGEVALPMKESVSPTAGNRARALSPAAFAERITSEKRRASIRPSQK